LQKAGLGVGLGAGLEIATARQRGTILIPTEFLHPTGFPLLIALFTALLRFHYLIFLTFF